MGGWKERGGREGDVMRERKADHKDFGPRGTARIRKSQG